ncbi:MAG: lytic polysaccharide monooxygenase [Myxococcales bacterium]|nr:lytic polysaccharide monooxygenase [Myxococcales bacterium]
MKRLSASAVALVFLASAHVASAHTVMSSPPARDFGKAGADAHKTGPCGGVARTANYTQYQAGQQVTVEFTETIDHRGCFQVLFSEANDQNFQILAQVDDPSGDVTPKKRTMTVTLPAGKTCTACTLSVRQLMINRACGANQQSINAGDTYFTCADICVGTNCPPQSDAGAPTDASVPPSDAGHSHDAAPQPTPSPTPSATGTPSGTPTPSPTPLEPTDESGGCSVGVGAAGSSGLAIVALGAALLGARRRRRAS